MSKPSRPLPPVLARFYDTPPTETADGVQTWICRGANFVVTVSKVTAGATLPRDNPDEYVLLTNDLAATVTAGADTLEAAPDTLTIVPPGTSRVVARTDGTLARVFSAEADDLAALATNAADYAEGAPLVAPLGRWPAPKAGYRLRNHVLSEHVTEGSFLRVFRTANLMVNPLAPWREPRNTHKLSPHSHADFEQASLSLESTWIHHLRTPWTQDMDDWVEDLHAEIGSPSVTVIPPTVVHTSRNIAPMGRLVDVFAPPRLDFLKQGVVRNADDYPMPAGL